MRNRRRVRLEMGVAVSLNSKFEENTRIGRWNPIQWELRGRILSWRLLHNL